MFWTWTDMFGFVATYLSCIGYFWQELFINKNNKSNWLLVLQCRWQCSISRKATFCFDLFSDIDVWLCFWFVLYFNFLNQGEKFSAHDEITNRKLLWHGTNVAVVAAILKRGLRIMPHSGGRVGRGIYFASDFRKSYAYGKYRSYMYIHLSV